MKKSIIMIVCLLSTMLFAVDCAAQQIDVNDVSMTIPDTYQSSGYLMDTTQGICYANFEDTSTKEGAGIRIQPSDIPNAATLNDVPDSKLLEETNFAFSEMAKAGMQIKNTPNFARVTVNGYPAMLTTIDAIVPKGHFITYCYTLVKDQKIIYVLYSCPSDQTDSFQPAIVQMNSTLHI